MCEKYRPKAKHSHYIMMPHQSWRICKQPIASRIARMTSLQRYLIWKHLSCLIIDRLKNIDRPLLFRSTIPDCTWSTCGCGRIGGGTRERTYGLSSQGQHSAS